MRRIRAALLLAASLAVAAACGSTGGSSTLGDNGTSSGSDGGSSSGLGPLVGSDGSDNGDTGSPVGAPISIEPIDQSVTVTSGAATTIQYVAKIAATGQVIPASWAIDRGELGSIGLTNGLFTASGTFGGKAQITATYQGQTAKTSLTIKLKVFENGGGAAADAGGGGAGGNGGVGGDGPGGAVDDATVQILHGAPTADPGLSLLYPYDATVWPRGILAPLLMWKPGAAASYDAVSIKLTSSTFEYEGVYKKNASPFKNHPISQQPWAQMLSSNQGDDVDVTITFAKDAKAYGPLHVKWKVASAPLKGIVYYNSYGTKLAKNFDGALTANPAVKDKFGGATLGVHGGSTDPVLVAGGDGDATKCRVCHSVAANGSVLITQRETSEKQKFSTYDLKQAYPNGETPMTPEGSDGGVDVAPYAWSAIYPDGTLFLNDSSTAAGSTGVGPTAPGNTLWTVVSGTDPKAPTPVPTTGWPAGLRAAYPAFSPDGKSLAFTMFEGADTGSLNTRTLGYMPFDKTTSMWGPMKALFTPPQPAAPASPQTALYPAFLPTNDAVIFEVETEYNGHDYGGTRSRQDTNGHPGNDLTKPEDPTLVYNRDHGAHGELWWVQTAGGTTTAVPLQRLNGKGYIPEGPPGSGHDAHADETLNYEPTVNPVPSGGYAWVVFTSRRLYGNVATQNPFWSDPRFHDLTTDPTPKKLWVAAIDLNAPPGTDPSHPAFYLPAQELLAGNSRGYWVVDPCKNDGNGCASGDECCGGFCRPDGTNKLVCSNVVPVCAQEFENCKTTSDCCNNPDYLCINGRCATPGVK